MKLQRKQLKGMTDADFGLDDVHWDEQAHDPQAAEWDGVEHEALNHPSFSDSMPVEQRISLLRSRYPELLPLVEEFLDLHPRLEQLHLDAAAAKSQPDARLRHGMTIAEAKWTALSAYLAALSMYLALVSAGSRWGNEHGKARPPDELQKHAIMDSLLRCRKVWASWKGVTTAGLKLRLPEQDVKRASAGPVQTEDSAVASAETPKKQKKRSRKSKAQRAAEEALAKANTQRRERLLRMQQRLAKLAKADTSTGSPPRSLGPLVPDGSDGSDLGEETALGEHEASEKAKRKKSLRFYTAQIAQKVNKRDSARRTAGGDTDIPYRERFRDRQLRLNAEATARGQQGKDIANAQLAQETDDDADAAAAQAGRQAADEGYYEQIAAQVSVKKAAKAARPEVRSDAASGRSGTQPGLNDGAHGKRGLTYVIEKNKGITPSGKRSVRNPRVKKRQKFEDKLKKLNSVRPTYKGGEGRGGYGGELTGIKSNLVKSVKL